MVSFLLVRKWIRSLFRGTPGTETSVRRSRAWIPFAAFVVLATVSWSPKKTGPPGEDAPGGPTWALLVHLQLEGASGNVTFSEGDTVVLRDVDPLTSWYKGGEITVRIDPEGFVFISDLQRDRAYSLYRLDRPGGCSMLLRSVNSLAFHVGENSRAAVVGVEAILRVDGTVFQQPGICR